VAVSGAEKLRLNFDDRLIISNRADVEMSLMADRHYSRRTIGSAQFTGPGTDLVLRNAEATVLFVWVWHNKAGEQLQRWDKQTGYCCSLFRNESPRLASDIILEAESIAIEEWGPNRAYTYIDPAKIQRSRTPGRCFLKAGWKRIGESKGGLILLEKDLA